MIMTVVAGVAAFAECEEKQEAKADAAQRHHPSRDEARGRWVDYLEGDYAETAIGCLQSVCVYDGETIRRVRTAALASNEERTHRASLEYFKTGVEASRESKEVLLTAVGDYIYHRQGAIRLDAATFLLAQGNARWKGVVRGASTDFVRLQQVSDDEHEESIRTILTRDLSDEYERRLRALLLARAKRMASV